MKALQTIKFSALASIVLMALVAIIPVRSGLSQPTDTSKPAVMPTVPTVPAPAAPSVPAPAIQDRVAEKTAKLKEENLDRAKDAEAIKRSVGNLNSSMDELAAVAAKANAAADSIAAAAAAAVRSAAADDDQDAAEPAAMPDSIKSIKRRPDAGHWWLRIFGR